MVKKLKIIKSNIFKIPLFCMCISQWNGSVRIFPHGSEYEYYLLLEWVRGLVLLPRKSHGRRSLVGCSPWGREESDTTERLHFHFSLSCIGEGNGGPLQCSCLENPRDGGAWWAAVSGVAQSRTRLKRLSSSSGSRGLVLILFLFVILIEVSVKNPYL